MDIHHITHRTAEECRATAELAKHASWSQAINTFHAKLDIQVMSRKNNPETPAITSRLMRKHRTVLNYLESRYADFYRRYDYAQPLPDDGLPGGGQSMAVLVARHRQRPGAGATVRGVHSAQRQRT